MSTACQDPTSASSFLLEGAACAGFVAPETGAASSSALANSAHERVDLARASWADSLDAFTQNHAGRLSLLETVDADGIPSSREQGYPFFGISYRPEEGVIEIILGEANGRRRHMTRAIRNATVVAVLRDAAGVDEAVIIAHGQGETTLEIIPRAPDLRGSRAPMMRPVLASGQEWSEAMVGPSSQAAAADAVRTAIRDGERAVCEGRLDETTVQLREAVEAYVDRRRAEGALPERIFVELKQLRALERRPSVKSSDGVPDALTPLLLMWCLQHYFGEDSSTS